MVAADPQPERRTAGPGPGAAPPGDPGYPGGLQPRRLGDRSSATDSRWPDHPAAMVPRHRPAAARPDRRHRPRPARSARRPPDTTAAAARQAFAAASDRANRRTPAAVLAALHPAAASVPAPQPAVDRLAVGQAAPAPAAAAWDAGRAVWDSEGGHPLG